ncbi:MAG: ATP synthase F1 subunit delta [Chloroflexaceae bacterium]|jgi:F-type H+-transporting ATPase subunit delta|nr:ATP synthase F1 subunit delta [Chloroflexaceae bacterium]
MATTTDSGTIARALYDSIITTVIDQLRAAAPNLANVSDSDPNLAQRVEAALPAKALPEVRNFILALAREGALDQLPSVVQAFENYGRGTPQVLEAEVTSAVALNDLQRDRISSDLRQRYGSDLELTFKVDESLIGGLIIRVGDQVLDNSLRARLGTLQRNMLAS